MLMAEIIRKKRDGGALNAEERPRELARMLGGPSRSVTALDHANELLEAAARLKRRTKGASR
jgi:DNA repair ATPase RecN